MMKIILQRIARLKSSPVLKRINLFVLLAAIFLPQSHLLAFQGNGALGIELLTLDTSNFPEIRAELRVRHSDSSAVTDLEITNFTLWEDRIEQPNQTLASFGGDSGGAAITMIMDVSGSMDSDLAAAKVAAIDFVNLLNPLDQAALVSFDANARVEHDFTFEKSEIIAAINALKTGRGTALYDAIVEGMRIIRPIDGKKAMVVLADGHDSRSSTSLDALLNQLAAEGIPVYLIGLGRTLDYKSEAKMQQIAQASGGEYFRSPTTAQLAAIYQQIAYIISNQYYELSYTAANCIEDGSVRTLKIEIEQGGSRGELTRQYTAPGYYVTLKPEIDSRPAAGEPFRLRVAIPPSSKPLFNLHQIDFTLNYDASLVHLSAPADAAILAGNLLGPESDRLFDFSLNESKGEINFSIETMAPEAIFTGKGTVAEIIFQSDSSLIDSTAFQFSLQNVRSQNPRGCDVALTINDAKSYTDGMWVWPGDTNHNGVVELSDVLRLGLYWNLRGPQRSANDRLAWEPQIVNKFTQTQATFADADGGGVIDERDLIPIAVNWAFSRKQARSNAGLAAKKLAPEPQGRLSIQNDDRPAPGNNTLRIFWQNASGAPLAGLTFKLHHPAAKTDSIAIFAGDGWRQQPLRFVYDDAETGIASVALMAPGGQFFEPENGEVVRVRLYSNNQQISEEILLKQIAFVGKQGQINEVDELQSTTMRVAEMPDDFKLYPAYPNPFNPTTKVVYDAPEAAHAAIHIYNSVGQMLKSAAFAIEAPGTFSYIWNGRDFSGRQVASGAYFIEVLMLSTSGNRYRGLQKVSLVK